MARILITRLSSFGDVAMLVPIVFSVAAKYPQDRFVVLTRKAFAPLFENLGFNVNAMSFDPNKHGSTFGLLSLINKISKSKYSHVADVHDVLRTKIIRTAMLLQGKKVAYIDKGRADKMKMIETKQLTPPLKRMTDRYMDVFKKLGFSADVTFNNYFELKSRSLYTLRSLITEKIGKWIGIAPFSKYDEKIYPISKMEEVLKEFSSRQGYTIFLFGSGKEEKSILENWEKKYPNVISTSGKIRLENELLLMSYLDVMISMDSANMHLASLVQVPVVSIWGATHPSLGFYGFGQDLKNAIYVDGLSCRPCSVFGNIPCKRGDLICLNSIKPTQIINKLDELLKVEPEPVFEKQEIEPKGRKKYIE